MPVWNVEALGIDRAVAALGAWKPDVLFSHGFLDPQIEEQTLDVAPAVFFAHDYYGTCISGFKTHRRPTTQPCDRVFGWRCLIEYHVRGAAAGARFPWCANSAVSRAASNDCAGIGRSSLTSDRMREEYVRHGFESARVVKVAYGIASEPIAAKDVTVTPRGRNGRWRLPSSSGAYTRSRAAGNSSTRCRRSSRLSNDRFRSRSQAMVRRERNGNSAPLLRLREPMIDVEFTGWLQPDELSRLYSQTDLVVMPSLWPEPFGLVGSEAGLHGVPVAAFAVGGIPDWLRPGVNGALASGSPPTVSGLADAIIECLRNDETHERLRQGARHVWSNRTFEHHLASLLAVFEDIRRAA